MRRRLATIGPSGTADLSYITDLDQYRQQFIAAMDDDFNTAGALAALFDMNREINRQINSGETISRGTLAGIDRLYRELGGEVLGIIPDELGVEQASAGLESNLMQLLIDLRNEYRRDQEFDKADAIRDRLTLLGVVLEDQPNGTTWHPSNEGVE